MKRIIVGAWTIIVIFLVVVVWLNSPPLNRSLTNLVFLLNYLQRLSALLAFVMLADQIVTGAFMPRITEKLGGWFFSYHITLGAVAYALIFAHPLLYLVFLTLAGNGINPFFVFGDICILCETRHQLNVSLGRIGFWLLIVAGMAAYFRVKIYQLRAYWRYLHIINYIAFFFIAVHAWYTGSDVIWTSYKYIYFFIVGAVVLTLIYRLGSLFKKNFKLK